MAAASQAPVIYRPEISTDSKFSRGVGVVQPRDPRHDRILDLTCTPGTRWP